MNQIDMFAEKMKTTKTIYVHHIRVPVDTSERRDNADKLFKVIRRLYDETGKDGTFHGFIQVIMGVLNRFADGDASYMLAIKGMSRKAVEICAEGWAVLVTHFWHEGCFYDILGDVYMQVRSDWAGKRMGQYFTPWSVCKMMAAMTGEADLAALDAGEEVTAYDPTCGSGAMLLAKLAHIADCASEDEDPRRFLRNVRISGQDLDRVCVDMARIQLLMSDGWWMSNFMMANYTKQK